MCKGIGEVEDVVKNLDDDEVAEIHSGGADGALSGFKDMAESVKVACSRGILVEGMFWCGMEPAEDREGDWLRVSRGRTIDEGRVRSGAGARSKAASFSSTLWCSCC